MQQGRVKATNKEQRILFFTSRGLKSPAIAKERVKVSEDRYLQVFEEVRSDWFDPKASWLWMSIKEYSRN